MPTNRTDLTPTQLPRFKQFMRATKGVPDYSVAIALSSLTPGRDWRKCMRGHMAAEWAKAPDKPGFSGGSSLHLVTITQLCEKIKEVLAQRELKKRGPRRRGY